MGYPMLPVPLTPPNASASDHSLAVFWPCLSRLLGWFQFPNREAAVFAVREGGGVGWRAKRAWAS